MLLMMIVAVVLLLGLMMLMLQFLKQSTIMIMILPVVQCHAQGLHM